MSFSPARIGKKEGGKERFKSGGMRVKGGADTGLAPDCIYSSTKRFTFTKSFQLHGARRISTLLSSFGDVILLAAIAERRGCEQLYDSLSLCLPFFVTPSPSLSFCFSLPERLQSRSGESFRKSLEEAYRSLSYTGTSISLRAQLHLDFVSLSASRYL